jgi:hypothetical protein
LLTTYNRLTFFLVRGYARHRLYYVSRQQDWLPVGIRDKQKSRTRLLFTVRTFAAFDKNGISPVSFCRVEKRKYCADFIYHIFSPHYHPIGFFRFLIKEKTVSF